jgi:DNA-binding Lrp family transcriptional regulator
MYMKARGGIDLVYGEKITLDKKDKKILEQLYKDGRMPVSEIARKTGLKRDSIIHRLKKMLKQNAISFIRPTLNPPKLGYPLMNNVHFEMQNYSIDYEKKFMEYLQKNKNIIYIGVLSGRWDYKITIAAKNIEHFNQIFKDIKAKFSNFIRSYEISTIIKEPKYEWMINLIQ